MMIFAGGCLKVAVQDPLSGAAGLFSPVLCSVLVSLVFGNPPSCSSCPHCRADFKLFFRLSDALGIHSLDFVSEQIL